MNAFVGYRCQRKRFPYFVGAGLVIGLGHEKRTWKKERLITYVNFCHENGRSNFKKKEADRKMVLGHLLGTKSFQSIR
jgi:hypothetical protein